jgi:dihydrofolate reductase
MVLSLIAAVDKKLGIGKDNKLLWYLPADLQYFKRVTSGSTVIMGRKTYESIGRALPNRRNIVLTRTEDYEAPGCEVMEELFDAIKSCSKEGEVFIIGGAEIYRQAIQVADKIYLTRVDVETDADTFFPDFSLSAWKLIHLLKHKADEKNKYDYSFSIYQRVA